MPRPYEWPAGVGRGQIVVRLCINGRTGGLARLAGGVGGLKGGGLAGGRYD